MKYLIAIIFGFIHTFSNPTDTLLNDIKKAGILRVATYNSPTTYYKSADGWAGLEYDLLQRFATQLNVKIEYVMVDTPTDSLIKVQNNTVHLAAAGVFINAITKKLVRFGPSYQQVSTHLVYNKHYHKVRQKMSTLNENAQTITIAEGCKLGLQLVALKQKYPNIHWDEAHMHSSSELLAQLAENEIDYTIAASHDLAQAQRIYPDLSSLTQISGKQSLAWAFPRFSQDDSLYLAAIQFFNQLQHSGELMQLIDRHYGHMGTFNYLNTTAFYEHIKTRLPLYQSQFEKAAEEYGLDWQLLAAMAYQESRWDAGAVSRTGVRGLMMLTQATAKRMKIKNRKDPKQSIQGGAKYFALLYSQIPKTIPEPDRTWMTLASYNMGLGHINDARKLTEQAGKDPNRWIDVKLFIRKLSKSYWHKQTKHGYARGFEALKYVQRIREFYNIFQQQNKMQYQSHTDNKPTTVPIPIKIHPNQGKAL